MDVDQRYSIAYKGLKNGKHDFEFEVGKSLFEQFENSEIHDGDCKVSIALLRDETMLTLDIVIEGYVVVACDRCLEDCSIPVDYEDRLLVKFSDEVHDDFDGEVLWLLSGEDEVDLTQYIYESILLSLPYQRVHPEGECDPEMLERFRSITAHELERLEAETTKRDSEWSKLADLKKQMTAEADKDSDDAK